MSFVTVDQVKAALVLDLDNERIQLAIDDAEDEALQFLNRSGTSLEVVVAAASELSETGDGPRNFRSVRRAVILLTENYLDDGVPAAKEWNRTQAERLLYPYREKLGV